MVRPEVYPLHSRRTLEVPSGTGALAKAEAHALEPPADMLRKFGVPAF